MELIPRHFRINIPIVPISAQFRSKITLSFSLFEDRKKKDARVNPLNTNSAVNSVENNPGDHRKGNACNRPFANFHPRFALSCIREIETRGGREIWRWCHFPASVSWRNDKKREKREMKKHRNTCKCSNRNPLNRGNRGKETAKKVVKHLQRVPIILNRVKLSKFPYDF